MARVLVTGAAGAVGRPVCRELIRRGHEVVAFDQREVLGSPQLIHGNVADRAAVDSAMRDVDSVVHLAAQPHDVAFEQLVEPNVLGLYQVMASAREHHVRRVILASSIQVLGKRRDPTRPAGTDEASPSNHYALTKLWAESMGEMYARNYGLSVICVRIAWMVRDVGEAQHMNATNRPDLYLSAGDAGRFFAQAVEAPAIDFAVLYAASRGGERLYDMEPSRRLIGYVPQDRWPSGLPFEVV